MFFFLLFRHLTYLFFIATNSNFFDNMPQGTRATRNRRERLPPFVGVFFLLLRAKSAERPWNGRFFWEVLFITTRAATGAVPRNANTREIKGAQDALRRVLSVWYVFFFYLFITTNHFFSAIDSFFGYEMKYHHRHLDGRFPFTPTATSTPRTTYRLQNGPNDGLASVKHRFFILFIFYFFVFLYYYSLLIRVILCSFKW